MRQHIINKKDFEGYEFKHEVAGSYGQAENKSLLIIGNGLGGIKYSVVNKIMKFELDFTNLDDAIECYNKY